MKKPDQFYREIVNELLKKVKVQGLLSLKRNHVILLVAILLSDMDVIAQTLNFAWAKQQGGTNRDEATAIAVDANGNVYTTGFFTGTADFDPGPAVFNLTTTAVNAVFVSKLDASGNFIWAKKLNESNAYLALGSKSIAVDASGNVYTMGSFDGSADFDPGPGTYSLTSAGGLDIFISKLDAAGNFIWAKPMGWIYDDQGGALAISGDGSIYITGNFFFISEFDPGPQGYFLISTGGQDMFICKLDASGNFSWAINRGGTGNDYGRSMVIDVSGNLVIAGTFENSVDFGSGTLSSFGNDDIFISKFSDSGAFLWAKQIGGQSIDRCLSVAADASGNICATGYFSGTADFDPGAATFNLSSAGNDDIFILKLDVSGNLSWAKRIGGISSDKASSVAVDAASNVYTTGAFQNTVDFDPGPNGFNQTSLNGDAFVSKLDAAGNFTWAIKYGGGGSDAGTAVLQDLGGNIYTSGYFGGTADFNPGTGTFNLTSAGDNDIFCC